MEFPISDSDITIWNLDIYAKEIDHKCNQIMSVI